MVADLIAFGRLVALALCRHHVQQLRALGGAQRLQRGQQGGHVVAVDRAGVVETHFLEHRGRHEHALPVFFPTLHEARRVVLLVPEDLLAAFAQCIERAAAGSTAEHLGQAADRLGDRHVVVVEDHQQIRFRLHAAGVHQRFEGHAGGHRTVTDHRHDLAVVAFGLASDGHAERGRDRGRRMADAEGVVLALFTLRERCHAVLLLDGVDLVAATGQDLVWVGLVTDVPDQLVLRGLVQVVQGHGEFDHAQTGGEVAAALAHRLDEVGTQFVGDRPQFGFVERAQVIRCLDAREAGIAGRVDHHVRTCSERPFSPSNGGGASKRRRP
ncbi:Uncharacterised protein [Stenotrophomonas maltophilia]|nr:Uncharacterised protein [Stenotrophomonas maltophilia]